MNFLGALAIAVNVHGVLEFSDDHRPKVTYEKHIRYQRKYQKAGNMKRMPNRKFNYNIMMDVTKTKGNVENNDGSQFVIAEPRGWENGKPLYYARMSCNKYFKKCVSLTNNWSE